MLMILFTKTFIKKEKRGKGVKKIQRKKWKKEKEKIRLSKPIFQVFTKYLINRHIAPNAMEVQRWLRHEFCPLKILSWLIPATQEADAGESLEPKRYMLQWADIAPLHSSLGDWARLCLKKKIIIIGT